MVGIDGLFLRASLAEIEAAAVGSRVDRISQPDPNLVLFTLWGRGQRSRLLINVVPGASGIYITRHPWQNPAQPPMFTMALRKRLLGGRLTGVKQPGTDRIATFTFTTRRKQKEILWRLTAELFGPRPRLVLTDADGVIAAALHRRAVDDDSPAGQAGQLYSPPPERKSFWDPLTDDEARLRALLVRQLAAGASPRQALRGKIAGAGPTLIRETLLLAFGSEALEQEITSSPVPGPSVNERAAQLSQGVMGWARAWRQKGSSPTVVFPPRGKKGLAVVPLPGHRRAGWTTRSFATCGEAADAALSHGYTAEQQQRQVGRLRQQIKGALSKAQRLVRARQGDLQRGEQGERWRLYADLLTANLWQWPGVHTLGNEVQVDNLLDPGGPPVVIPLDPALTPNENARRYYSRYRRARRTLEKAAAKLAEAEEEAAYLASLLVHLNHAETEAEVADVAAEWESWHRRQKRTGGGPARKRPGLTRQTDGSRPRRFRSPAGLDIFVGRNNRQNDRLTFSQGAPYDLWFHTRNIPGSHVVVRLPHARAPVDDETLHVAALLAAYYSQARHGSGVPVDWTRIKNVRKIPGARPGMVRYDGQQTLTVTPDWNKVKDLQVTEEE